MDNAELQAGILELFALGEDGLTPAFVAMAFPEYPLAQIRFTMAQLCEEGVLELVDGKMRLVRDTPSDPAPAPIEVEPPQASDQMPEQEEPEPEPAPTVQQDDAPTEDIPGTADPSDLLSSYDGERFPIADMPTTFCKPVAFAFGGKVYPARKWRILMVELLSALSVNHGAVLKQVAAEEDARPGKRKKYPISGDSSRFIKALHIAGTDLWVEGVQSANQIKSCCLKLLKRCGVRPDEVVVCLRVPREDEIQRPNRKSRKVRSISQENGSAALDAHPSADSLVTPQSAEWVEAEHQKLGSVANTTPKPQVEPSAPQQPAPAPAESFNYTPGRAGIRPASSRRVITNNLFSLALVPDTSTGTANNEFELRFVDERGRTLCADQTVRVVDGKVIPKRVRFNLTTRPDSGKTYHLVVHETGQPPERVAARFTYTSSVVFATEDFDV